MDQELIKERIAHAETRIALCQVQGQLLSLVAEKETAVLAGLRAQIEPAQPAPPPA